MRSFMVILVAAACSDDPAGDAYRPDLIGFSGTVCTSDPTELGAVAPLVLEQLVVSNTNLLFGSNGFAMDSDGDGIADRDEHATSPESWDSDGDGIGDGIEERALDQDPTVADRPGACPSAGADTDLDLLNGCEEYVLGTDPMVADSDGDGFPDALEAWAGTDATTAEGDTLDSDSDGWTNARELSAHTNPLVRDAAGREAAAYSYEISAPITELDRNCYEIEVSNIALTTTEAAIGALDEGVEHDAGSNHIIVWVTEARADDLGAPGLTRAIEVRVLLGCLNPAQLVSCSRDPANAILDFSELNPVPLR